MMRSEDQAIDLLRRIFGTKTVVGVADSEANEGDCVRECTDPIRPTAAYKATGDEQHRPARVNAIVSRASGCFKSGGRGAGTRSASQ